ncbi:MAG: LacI family DNA-binding transcriptional regulator [Mycobacteriales bacterium]
MEKAPTIYEVAQLAGVSTATVSRALTDAHKLRPVTRDRVLTAARELGYVPSGSARGLAARRTRVFGLCFPDYGDSEAESSGTTLYSDEVIRGMERAARKSGYAVLIAASPSDEVADLLLGMAGQTDGLAVLASALPAGLQQRIRRRVPVVMLAGRAEPDHVDRACVANTQGARELTRHLVEDHGLTDTVFLGGPLGSPDSAERQRGYETALKSAGLHSRGHLTGDFTEASGRSAAAGLVGGRLPQALVCANDQMAVGAMAQFGESGVRVPADVAVVGFDDIALARHVAPALTTVRQPMRRLGELAVELLQQRLADPDRPGQAITLPVQLVRRRSCGCGAIAQDQQHAIRPDAG